MGEIRRGIRVAGKRPQFRAGHARRLSASSGTDDFSRSVPRAKNGWQSPCSSARASAAESTVALAASNQGPGVATPKEKSQLPSPNSETRSRTASRHKWLLPCQVRARRQLFPSHLNLLAKIRELRFSRIARNPLHLATRSTPEPLVRALLLSNRGFCANPP